MAEPFPVGSRVRTRRHDPPHHTRVPRYARGATGTVVDVAGSYPLPDDRVRGIASPPQRVYTVRFSARELFGAGEHHITVDLWEGYLEPAPDRGEHP